MPHGSPLSFLSHYTSTKGHHAAWPWGLAMAIAPLLLKRSLVLGMFSQRRMLVRWHFGPETTNDSAMMDRLPARMARETTQAKQRERLQTIVASDLLHKFPPRLMSLVRRLVPGMPGVRGCDMHNQSFRVA